MNTQTPTDPPSTTTNDQSELCKWLLGFARISPATFTLSHNTTYDSITNTYNTRLNLYHTGKFHFHYTLNERDSFDGDTTVRNTIATGTWSVNTSTNLIILNGKQTNKTINYKYSVDDSDEEYSEDSDFKMTIIDISSWINHN